jgi:hypothetical protein
VFSSRPTLSTITVGSSSGTGRIVAVTTCAAGQAVAARRHHASSDWRSHRCRRRRRLPPREDSSTRNPHAVAGRSAGPSCMAVVGQRACAVEGTTVRPPDRARSLTGRVTAAVLVHVGIEVVAVGPDGQPRRSSRRRRRSPSQASRPPLPHGATGRRIANDRKRHAWKQEARSWMHQVARSRRRASLHPR